jgi:hypothetical protein
MTQDCDYVFKADDDTYIAAERILNYDRDGADYIGAAFRSDIGCASGGAGYWLSRKAVEIVANQLTDICWAEDFAVGKLLEANRIRLKNDERFIQFGDSVRRPLADNDIISTHKISEVDWLATHKEVGGTAVLL